MNILHRATARLSLHRQLLRLTRRVAALEIDEAGVAEDGVPFVRLRAGPVFFGLPTRRAYRPYHRRLPAALRRIIPPEAFQVALDIVIRYQEGGLQLGGPRKEAHYSVREGDTVAEMGAYLGFYTLYLAQRVGPKGRVIAIEAVPENVALLRRNVEANGLAQVTVVPKGVWNEAGRLPARLRDGDWQSGSLLLEHEGGHSLYFEVDTLDAMLEAAAVDRVDLMIIQLNGAEKEALEGLTTFHPQHLAIAARYGGRSDAAAVAAELDRRGYATQRENGDFVFAALAGPG